MEDEEIGVAFNFFDKFISFQIEESKCSFILQN